MRGRRSSRFAGLHAVRCCAVALLVAAGGLPAASLIPEAAGIARDRPRLLLRPGATPRAISLAQLRALPRDRDYARMLEQIERLEPPRAAALALAYLLTGRTEAADRAAAVLRAWQDPEGSRDDPFTVYFTLLDMALAYDWLHGCPAFDEQARADLRRKLQPFVENAFKLGNDHVFHNYIWMYHGGAMLWALAAAGEDQAADRLFERMRERFNGQLFRAMEYLEGSNGDSAGYWWLYCQPAATLVLLAAQSAFEADLAGAVRREHGGWLDRQLEYVALTVLPDLRFAPWGDIVAGPNGGATHEMADKIDALAWALRSPSGAFLSRRLAEKRGLARFHGETGIFYFLYTRHLTVDPAPPPLAVLAGGKGGGHVLMRSDWSENATVVGFRCTDYYGQHNHLDQGSFFIYRNGWLALDAGTYRRVGGDQARTDAHNTILLGGEGQRRESYQSAATLEEFTRRLPRGLETGDLPFYRHAGAWTAAAGEFAQAYAGGTIRSCVRQILFVRPGTLVVVDRLAAPEGASLPEVRWLLQVPARPQVDGGTVTALSAASYLRCRSLVPGAPAPTVEDSYRTPAGPTSSGGNPASIDASRVVFAYEGAPRLTLVHVIEVGDGKPPPPAQDIAVEAAPDAARIAVEGSAFSFSASPPYEVAREKE